MKVDYDEKNEIWQGRCDLGGFYIMHSDGKYVCIYNVGNVAGRDVKESYEEALDWCFVAILDAVLNGIQTLAPDGQRVDLTNWKYVCGATLEGVGWNCSLEPGHTGDHYCEWKGVYWK